MTEHEIGLRILQLAACESAVEIAEQSVKEATSAYLEIHKEIRGGKCEQGRDIASEAGRAWQRVRDAEVELEIARHCETKMWTALDRDGKRAVREGLAAQGYKRFGESTESQPTPPPPRLVPIDEV